MALARRYRWELGPLLIAASVVWARPLLPDETTGVLALWHLGIAALLAAGLVRVSRLGRPLLTALWEVTLARLGSLAAGYASIALRQQNLDLGSVGFGLLQTLMQVVAVGIVIWLAWRQGAGGRRYAMLVCAGYLVPRFSGWIGSAWIGPDPGLVVLVLAGATLALQLASVAAVAVAFGRFGELAAERQRRVVVWLLALPLAAAGLHSLLLFVQFGGQDRGSPVFFVPWSLWPFGAYALAAGVLLGVTWLVTLAPLRRGQARTAACGVLAAHVLAAAWR